MMTPTQDEQDLDQAYREAGLTPRSGRSQAAAAIAPAAPSAAPGNSMRMMDTPEGAQIRRTVSMQDADGRQVREVASWIHSPVAPAAQPEQTRFQRLDAQRQSMGGSVEARQRRMDYGDRMRMMDTNRIDRVNKEGADRMTQETLEAIKASGQMGAEGAKAGAAVAVARENAGAVAADRAQDAFFRGIDQAGRQRDDARSDEQLGLNRDQLGMQKGRDQRDREWDDKIRMRVDADVLRGRQTNQPVETWKDPTSGRQFYRSWGDIDPKTGEKTGWKPVTSDVMGSLGGGAAAGATPDAGGQPAAGGQAEKRVIGESVDKKTGRRYRRYSDGSFEFSDSGSSGSF
jgi:hypothetical protein